MKPEYYIALDIGGTRTKIGIFKNDLLLISKSFASKSGQNLSESLIDFKTNINQLLDEFDVRNNLAGIGFAFAGLVDVRKKKIIDTNDKYSSSSELNIEKWVYDNWEVPFFIDNDARMAAVGEWKYGSAKNTDDLVMVTLGTGIGTSSIINGKLLRGRHYQAGCLGGHFTIALNGRLCNCGNHDCAEAYASTWALVKRVKNDKKFEESILSNTEIIDYKQVFQAAERNDALALEIINESLNVWTAVIVNLIHAYDPDTIVIGGGIMESSDFIIPKLEGKVQQKAWTPWGKVEIQKSQLKNLSALYGINYSLQNPIKNE